MHDDKGIKLLVKKLNSPDSKETLLAINQIKESGDPEILPNLLDLLITNTQNSIIDAIIELLNELKNQAGTISIINALKDPRFTSFKKELLTSCWYSGLDYSEHLPYFVATFISNDFLIAFEAFTIIETFEIEYEKDLINPLIQDIKRNINEMDNEKKSLGIELIHLLEKKIVESETKD